MFKAKVKEEIFNILKNHDVLSINDTTLLDEMLNEVINDLTVVKNLNKLKDLKNDSST
ncbi:hypothetical protein [Providencia hangzhouensis]|uniref:hypothetical protein n=1 Tax=Providencia hangzhouensis TaxID=3031799 RepID=UPI00397BC5FB